jgi:ligand-binding SRPBCC domain-containing protein
MPLIELTTAIHAPINRCFDLARSIDLHKLSTEGTQEEAIAGVKSGLIGKGEQVTWRAKHFGVTQHLTSKITEFQSPYRFRDEMLDGVFKMIRHDHLFEESGDKTIMRDKFEFESPAGFLGLIVNKLILEKYLRNLLIKRNRMIKEVAEGDQWKTILTN